MLRLYSARYWKQHYKKALAFVISIALVTLAVVMFFFNERTQQRRRLHSAYDNEGNYQLVAHGVPTEEIDELRAMPAVAESGVAEWAGYCIHADMRLSFGCVHADAKPLLHYPFTEGGYPQQVGEIAVPSFLLTGPNTDCHVGDTVTLQFENADGSLRSESYRLCGIIGPMHRSSLDYLYTEGQGYFAQPWDDFQLGLPAILFHPDALKEVETQNIVLLCPHPQVYSTDENSPEWTSLQQTIAAVNEKQYPNVTSGGSASICAFFSETKNGTKEYAVGNDERFMQIIFGVMIVVSLISLVSVMYSILSERIRSLRLLKCIGMSKRQLCRLVLSEIAVGVLAGAVVGVGMACVMHEIQLAYQKTLGLAAYRGYTAEWLVQQVTVSPWLMLLLLTAVMLVGVSVYPVIRILRMSALYDGKPVTHRAGKRSARTVLPRLFRDKTVQTMQFISLTLVLCAVSLVYLYYTDSGKFTSYATFGQHGNAEAYTQSGVMMQEADVDCVLTGGGIYSPFGVGIQAGAAGIDAEVCSALSADADVYAWGSWAVNVSLMYPVESAVPESVAEFTYETGGLEPDWLKGNQFFRFPVVFMNDAMMQELGLDGNAVLVSTNPVRDLQAGDTMPLIAAEYDPKAKQVTQEHTEIIPITIDAVTSLSENQLFGDALHAAAASMLQEDIALVLSQSYAEELGIPSALCNVAALRYHENVTDKTILPLFRAVLPESVSSITQTQIHDELLRKRLAQLSSVFTVFFLFLALSMIGYYNVMQMNIRKNLERYRLLHQIGMSYRAIRQRIVRAAMVLPVYAAAATVVLICGFQWLEKQKYEYFVGVLDTQQQIFGIKNLATVVVPNLGDLKPGDPLYEPTWEIYRLKRTWFLEAEMWLVKPWVILICVSVIAFLFTALIARKTVRTVEQQAEERSADHE